MKSCQAERVSYGRQERDLAGFARALGHPARMRVVRLLVKAGELSCGELVRRLPLAQATVSQHLRVLERAGVVVGRACGVQVCYRLNRARIGVFCGAMQEALGRSKAPCAEDSNDKQEEIDNAV